ncbi:MAG: metallopeptidase [Clostridia bacterium]|nr:metallopeptidase [Clostridia bacterium]
MLSRNTLLVNLRFLDSALSRLEYIPYEDPFLMTDGKRFLYHPKSVLQTYRLEKEASVRDYLHIILHCVFQHMYVEPTIHHLYWDLACDMAVEFTISQLYLQAATASREKEQEKIKDILSKNTKALTAEMIYHYLREFCPDADQAAQLRSYFYADNHEIWYMTEEAAAAKFGFEPSSDSSGEGNSREQTKEDWKNIADRMRMDMETFQKARGDQAGNLIQNLKAITREKYDYSSFLKKFAVLGEQMKINDDEFDYNFYTYGLKLYGNMPLIEPLEYKEVKRIKEFVIAIDTSGSVAGELVQKFMQKTFNILKSEETFFSKINLHIIQCDAEIQETVKITCEEDFDNYLKNMQFHGFGGTDFRPVFSYVEELRQKKEFRNLKGLIYFTDGYGVFPAKKPDYETAFIFIRDEYEIPEVPPWAIKLVLESKEI